MKTSDMRPELSRLPAVGSHSSWGLDDSTPLSVELQGHRAIIEWAWAGVVPVAQLVLTDYGDLCLTVFASTPSMSETYTGNVAIAEAMADNELMLTDELATLGSQALIELATTLGARLGRRELAGENYQRRFRRW